MKHAPKISGQGLELEVLAGLQQPHSPACETLLLASILVDETSVSLAIAVQVGIRAKAFHLAEHRVIWEALNALHARGEAGVTVHHVRIELEQVGKLDAAGGWERLLEISGLVATTLHVRFLSEQLKLLWDRRGMIELAGEMRAAATDFEGREAFVGTATDIGERLVRLGRVNVVRTLADEIEDVKNEVSAAAEDRLDRSRWISSGLPLYDEKCHPFTGGREDQLIAVCGGSGDGKSVVLRQLAGATLRQGKRVLSFSRETSTAGFVEMLVASWTDIDLLHPQLWKKNLPAFVAECDRIRAEWADKRLFCVQHTAATPLSTVEDLVQHVRQFVNLRGQPDMILVDYLQLFGTRKRVGSNSDRVEEVSHQLQACIRELPGATMVVAAQLNESGLNELRQEKRDSEGRIIHTMPHRGMIRDSQAIYHDADRVIFLYRPPFDCRDSDQRSTACLQPEVWWVQDKRRRGGVNSVRCWFKKRFTRFEQIGRHETDEAEAREAVSRGIVPSGGVNKADWKKARVKNS